MSDAASLFDAKADTWSLKYAEGGSLTARCREVCDRIGPGAGQSLLDFGCGSGDISRSLAERGFLVSGCDISEKMIASALAGEAQGCSFSRLTSDRLPFADGVFDVVVAISVLEYVSEPLSVLTELRRVTRDRAAFHFTVPNLAHRSRVFERLVKPVVSRLPSMSRLGRFGQRVDRYGEYLAVSRCRLTAGSWAALLGSAGFRLESSAPLKSSPSMLAMSGRSF